VRFLRGIWHQPAEVGPRRTRWDWVVVALVLLLGTLEALTSGLGWQAERAVVAVVIAPVLLERRRAPLPALVVVAGITATTIVAFSVADHALPLSGLALLVAIYSLVRWASVRHLVVGLGVVVVHAVVVHLADPNSSVSAGSLIHGSAALTAGAARVRSDRPVRRSTDPAMEPGPQIAQVLLAGHTRRLAATSRALRVVTIVLLSAGLFVATQGTFIADQLASHATRARSPAMDAEWSIDAATLRRAAEASAGTHGPGGAVRHTVDYPHELLAALESPSSSVEGNVTVIDGTGFLQHDPRFAVGLPLLEFLEYAAIARFPVIKLDLKRDRVGTIIGEVDEAVDRFGLDPRHLQFNADVFRGPGVGEDVFGARADKSFTDRMYNLLVMELETSDLVRVAGHFPESTIVISSTTPTGPHDEGYSEDHLDQFIEAATEIRRKHPGQPLAFAVRGDLAAQSGPHLLQGLTAIDDSHVIAWWSADVRPRVGEVQALRAAGVTFFDPGPETEE
jgi:hypothetical protein